MSTDGQLLGTARKVPVWRTAVASYRFVFANLGRFLALGWLLMLAAAAPQIFATLVMGEPSGWSAESFQESPAHALANVLISGVYYAMHVVFAVRWHRFYLLDERRSVFSEILAARNWRFLGYVLLLALVPYLPMLIMLIVGWGAALSGVRLPPEGMVAELSAAIFIFAWLGTFILYFVFVRFSLVLPAAAVDRPIGLSESWRRLGGNTWRYIGAIILVLIPAIIVGLIVVALFVPFLIAGLPGGGQGPFVTFIVVWNILFGFFATAVGITVLSIFYRHIVGTDAPEGGAQVLAKGR